MKTYVLKIKKKISSETCWKELEKVGVQVLYETNENKVKEITIVASIPFESVLTQFLFVDACVESVLPEIDWANQWELHAPDFDNQQLKLNLNGKEVLLAPGSGFGDYSHPTTRLVLKMMSEHVDQQNVIDIGSGSGILSLAASVCGAKYVAGVDIDQEAVLHGYANAKLNPNLHVDFFLSDHDLRDFFSTPCVVLMNMIMSEQKEAWPHYVKQGIKPVKLFTSGILKKQKKEYLKISEAWGWELIKIEEEEEWLGFAFS